MIKTDEEERKIPEIYINFPLYNIFLCEIRINKNYYYYNYHYQRFLENIYFSIQILCLLVIKIPHL